MVSFLTVHIYLTSFQKYWHYKSKKDKIQPQLPCKWYLQACCYKGAESKARTFLQQEQQRSDMLCLSWSAGDDTQWAI
jgi:hypothetical protein